MIEIDGSVLEGGGQMLRTTLAVASLIGEPVKVYNIRAKRSNPGLQQQHLTGVLALKEITDAEVEGAYKGSTVLTFKPRGLKCGSFRFDIGTAGSVTLVAQVLLIPLAFAPCKSTVEITGGTDVHWSPPIDYARYVKLPVLSRMGVNANVRLIRRGHYPRGGGKVVLEVEPVDELTPLEEVEFGELVEIKGLSHCVRLPSHVAERQAKAAKEVLAEAFGVPVEIGVEYYEAGRDPHLGPGSGIVLWARSSRGNLIGADSLGERGKPAELVGREAAAKLVEELRSNMALDSHMGDMIVPYLALASGVSKVGISRITLHALTNVYVIERILRVKFEVEGTEGSRGLYRVRGIGYRR